MSHLKILNRTHYKNLSENKKKTILKDFTYFVVFPKNFYPYIMNENLKNVVLV